MRTVRNLTVYYRFLPQYFDMKRAIGCVSKTTLVPTSWIRWKDHRELTDSNIILFTQSNWRDAICFNCCITTTLSNSSWSSWRRSTKDTWVNFLFFRPSNSPMNPLTSSCQSSLFLFPEFFFSFLLLFSFLLFFVIFSIYSHSFQYSLYDYYHAMYMCIHFSPFFFIKPATLCNRKGVDVLWLILLMQNDQSWLLLSTIAFYKLTNKFFLLLNFRIFNLYKEFLSKIFRKIYLLKKKIFVK